MTKLKMHSKDLTQDNIAKIQVLFPNCVTEAQDADGELRLAVDFDLLKQELASDLVEGPQERYRLDWPGKREAMLLANSPIAKTLRPARDESVSFDSTENLFIEGDNLEALKLLQENYLGKVKMIYIDPPYNTGNDFVYNDDFATSSEEYFERSIQKDEEGNRLVANTESNGRYHSDWLSMMLPRLRLARNLLSDDGVIFISIDNNEQSNLKKICDEIFGENNFVNTISVIRSKNGLGSKEGFATNNDFLLCYKNNSNKDPFMYLRHDENYINRFNREDSYGKYKIDGLFRKKGAGQKKEDSPGCFYPLYFNSDKNQVSLSCFEGSQKIMPKLPSGEDGRWIWSKEYAESRIHRIHISKGSTVYIKDYLHDANRIKPKTIFDKNCYTTEFATEEIKELFGNKLFDTPKPKGLLIDLRNL